jgi:transposase
VVATERDEVRHDLWHRIVRKFDARWLVFVDESGANTSLALRYARAPRGQRAPGRVPRNHGRNITLVAGLAWEGLIAPMTIEGAIDTPAFEAYVQHVLIPALMPGQIVVLDNLAVHHKAAIRQLIEATGCRLLFLPSYSPDLSPIELAFAKLKAFLRRVAARTHDTLQDTIAQGIDRITPQDARGFFRHCGYHSPAQLF